jgi:DNA end-binding protein Ku
MFFADEIRDAHEEIGDLPGKVKARPSELKMAKQLVTSMSGPWRAGDYRDTYTDRVNDLIKAKKGNKDYEPAAEPPSATDAVDLMEALRQSVDAAKKPHSTANEATAKKTTARKATARKASARKATAKKATAKKATAKKATAKKTTAKKATAKKASPRKSARARAA